MRPRREQILLIGAVVLLGVSAPATAVARDRDGATSVQALKERAANGDAGAIFEAERLRLEAGGDPEGTSPLVRELEDLYQHSPAKAEREKAMEEQVAKGNSAPGLEAMKLAQLAGNESSPLAERLAKVWEEKGRDAAIDKLAVEAKTGKLKPAIDLARTLGLAGLDPETSPLVQYLEDLAKGKPATRPPYATHTKTATTGSGFGGSSSDKTAGSGGTPEATGGGDEGRSGDAFPETRTAGSGSSGSGSSGSAGTSESWHVTQTVGGEKTAEGTKTVTHNDDGTTTTTTVMTYTDGTTETTTTVTDSDGNVVTETTESTDSSTTTTEACDDDCDELTTPEQDEQRGTTSLTEEDMLSIVFTWKQMLEHPINNPEDTPGGVDIDGDGKPDLAPSHLDGHVDPAPDADELAVATQAPASHFFGTAGPEFGPDGPQEPAIGPDAPRDNGGTGPISTPRP
jgi:hypothetical protein